MLEWAELPIEHGIVGHIGEWALRFARLLRERNAVEKYFTAVGLQQSGDDSEAGGFTGAIRAEKCIEHSSWHAEIEAIHRAGRAELLVEAASLAGDRHGGRCKNGR